MVQASVEGNEASRRRCHLIASRVFVHMALVVSGVPQASFRSAAVGQFAGVGIFEVMSLVEEGLLCIPKVKCHCGLGQVAWPLLPKGDRREACWVLDDGWQRPLLATSGEQR